MALKDVIDSITNSFFSNKNESFMFFSVPSNMMKNVPSCIEADIKVIDLETDINPVKPFISIAKDCNPSDEHIDTYAYSPQRNPIKSFFRTGLADNRMDVIQFNEIPFEISMYTKYLEKIFDDFFDKYYLVLNAQLLPRESSYLLKSLIQKNYKGKIIFCFNNEQIEGSDQYLNDLYHSLENHRNFYEVTDYDDNNEYSEIDNREAEITDYDTLFNLLRNCRTFLSLDQGAKLCGLINSNNHKLNFNEFQMREINFEIGLLLFYAGRTDESQYYLTQVLECTIEDETNLAAYIALARVFLAKNSNTEALKYVRLVEQKLGANIYSPYYALAYMLDYSISQKTDTEHSLEKFNHALELLNYNGFINNYISTCLEIPWSAMNNSELREQMMPIVEGAIETAEQIGNKFALSTGYNWKGIILLHGGKVDEAHYWYSKCNELRTELGEIGGIIKIRNGLSYEYLISTRFKESYDLLNDYSDKLIDLTERTEIIITLNNIANTLFYSRHFLEAYTFYQKILRLLCSFHLEKQTVLSFVPEYNDILIHKAYIDLFDGNINRAKINFHNIRNNGRPYTSINEPIILLFQAILKLNENNLDDALDFMDKADAAFVNYSPAQAFRQVFIIYEFCTHLQEKNFTDEINYLLDRAFVIAKKHNLFYYLKDENTPISVDDYINNVEDFEPAKINLKMLEEKLENDQIMSNFHRRLRDSQFLNKIMSFGSDDLEEKKYVSKAIHAIIDYTVARGTFMAVRANTKWELIGSFCKEGVEQIPDNVWERLCAKYVGPRNYCKLFYDKETGYYFAYTAQHRYPGATIIVPDPAISFSPEDINILNVALDTIQSQIVIKRVTEKLQFISSTDQLSGLKNRRALQEKLAIESEMIRRYQVERAKYFQLSISFIDLDNFKFINDTFGHEVGDFIIQKFAELLKIVYRQVDFISRFGGDEFVILLPNTNCEEAHRAAERLHEALVKADHFVPDLKVMLAQDLDIPENKKLGFSMGICSNYDIEDPTDMTTTMTNADRALYYSKEHGKGQFIIWNDIKDIYNAENQK